MLVVFMHSLIPSTPENICMCILNVMCICVFNHAVHSTGICGLIKLHTHAVVNVLQLDPIAEEHKPKIIASP